MINKGVWGNKKTKLSEMQLYLLEYQEDVRFFLKKLLPKIGNKEYKIICLSPEPVLILEKARINFHYPEDVLPPEKLGNFAISSWSRSQKFCNLLDGEIKKSLSGLTANIPYFRGAFEDVRILFDSCRLRISQIQAVLDVFHPTEIHYFATTPLSFNYRMLWDDLESIYAHLLPFIVESMNPKPLLRCYPQQVKKNINWWIKRISLYWHPKLLVIKNAIKGILKEDLCKKTNLKPKTKVYCKMQGREAFLKYIIKEMQRLGWVVFGWNPLSYYNPAPTGGRIRRVYRIYKSRRLWKKLQGDMKVIWREIEQEVWFQDFFQIGKLNWYHVVRPRLQYLATVIIPHEILSVKEAKKLIPHIDGLIGSYFHTFTYPVAMLSRCHGKKVLTAQHDPQGFRQGGNGWPPMSHTLNYYADVEMATHALKWGEGVKDMMEKYGEIKTCEPVIIGAQHLKVMKEIEPIHREPQRVLYVLPSFDRNIYNFGIGSFTVNIRYNIARRIIDALCNKNSVVDIMIKDHPTSLCNSKPLVYYIKEKEYKVKIIKTGLFSDLLSEVDAVVIDTPTSPLGEALPTKLPIFLFTGSFKISNFAKGILNKRVYYEETLEKFCQILSDFVRHPDRYPAKLDNGFEKTYILPTAIDIGEILGSI